MEIMTKTGIALDTLIEMPVEQFMKLYETTLRVDAREKVDNAWAMMVAAQGQKDNMTTITDHWLKRAKITPQVGGDARKFLKDLGMVGGKGSV